MVVIKATSVTVRGRPIVILGLSAVNVERMRADEPILVDGDEIGIDVDIVVFGGRGDEADLEARLREFFTIEHREGP